MQVPRLANDDTNLRLRVPQRDHADVVFGSRSTSPRHAERRDRRMLQVEVSRSREVFGVLRIRKWITPFDEVKAQLIQPLRDEQFVLEREVHPLALAAVAKGRIVDLNASHLPDRFCLSGDLVLLLRGRFTGCDFM